MKKELYIYIYIKDSDALIQSYAKYIDKEYLFVNITKCGTVIKDKPEFLFY